MRGLALSAAATAARSSAPCTLRSLPFGKYCHSSPLVFSFVLRCRGLRTDADTGRIVASALTDKGADDGSQVGPLLDQLDGPVVDDTESP